MVTITSFKNATFQDEESQRVHETEISGEILINTTWIAEHYDDKQRTEYKNVVLELEKEIKALFNNKTNLRYNLLSVSGTDLRPKEGSVLFSFDLVFSDVYINGKELQHVLQQKVLSHKKTEGTTLPWLRRAFTHSIKIGDKKSLGEKRGLQKVQNLGIFLLVILLIAICIALVVEISKVDHNLPSENNTGPKPTTNGYTKERESTVARTTTTNQETQTRKITTNEVTTMAGTLKSTTMTEHETTKITMKENDTTGTMIEKNTTTTIDEKTTIAKVNATTTMMEQETITITTDQATPTVELEKTTTAMYKGTTTTMMTEGTTTIMMDKGTKTTMMDKETTTTMMAEGTTTSMMTEGTTTIMMDKGTKTTMMDKETTTTMMAEGTTIPMMNDNTTTTISPEGTTTNIMAEGNTTTMMNGNTTTTIMTEGTTTTMMAEEETTTMIAEGTTTMMNNKGTATTMMVEGTTTTMMAEETTTMMMNKVITTAMMDEGTTTTMMAEGTTATKMAEGTTTTMTEGTTTTMMAEGTTTMMTEGTTTMMMDERTPATMMDKGTTTTMMDTRTTVTMMAEGTTTTTKVDQGATAISTEKEKNTTEQTGSELTMNEGFSLNQMNVLQSLGFLLITLPFVVNRKNDWCDSKGEPDPFNFWKLLASKHDEEYNSSHTYAELHNVALVEREGQFGVLSFDGSNDSYVYIDNVNKSYSVGEYAMSWMMYLEPDESDSRSTILKYQDENGNVPFHLELLSDGTLSCTMQDTNGTQYNEISSIEVKERKFIGVNFNFLWEKQFDFFHVYTDDDGKQIVDADQLTLNDVPFSLYLEDTTHVIIGSGFQGNISCIQFYNSSVIKSPLKAAPLLCDPVLAIGGSFGDYTIDVSETKTQTVLQFPTTITQPTSVLSHSQITEAQKSTENSKETSDDTSSTSYSSLKTPIEVHTNSVTSQRAISEAPTTSITSEDISFEAQTSSLVRVTLSTQVPTSSVTPEDKFSKAQTTPLLSEGLSTQVHTSSVTPEDKLSEPLTTSMIIPLSSTADNSVIKESCVYFRRIANDTTIINPVLFQIATNLNDCAQLCWETTSCFQFSVVHGMRFANCYIGDSTHITATLFGSNLYSKL
ncbi:unnamed protein product [Mytilus coruscus]|uniref:Apple domain-containing protein n=1 Tax=Mytilus coruscus TaxID=42192 RepID=A0A6J8DDG4_MYTCO|nr:unnamed protein product [Mytilus coruscus]